MLVYSDGISVPFLAKDESVYVLAFQRIGEPVGMKAALGNRHTKRRKGG